MSVSIWNQIIANMITRFEAIQTAAGYATDTGRYVSYYRSEAMDMDLLPGINLMDTGEVSSDRDTPFNLQSNRRRMAILCVAKGTTAKAAKDAAEDVYLDVMKAVGTATGGFVGETWGGLAISTEKGEISIEVNKQSEYFIGQILVQFEIWYRHTRWNPYTS